jgi:hypothetical protein
MTVDELKIQIALGTITEDQLKRIGVQRKHLSAKTIRVYRSSWVHNIIVKLFEHKYGLTRTEITNNAEGAWLPLKRAEIFGWIKRDFSYTRYAGTGRPLTLTPLGQKVYEIIASRTKKSELVPIEINFEALQGFLYLKGEFK